VDIGLGAGFVRYGFYEVYCVLMMGWGMDQCVFGVFICSDGSVYGNGKLITVAQGSMTSKTHDRASVYGSFYF